jgi:hypothetical protein
VNILRTLDKFRVPLGNQEIELQEVAHDSGGMPLLRIRIRERSRFTVFEVDAVTANQWAKTMQAWADANGGDTPPLIPSEELTGNAE